MGPPSAAWVGVVRSKPADDTTYVAELRNEGATGLFIRIASQYTFYFVRFQLLK